VCEKCRHAYPLVMSSSEVTICCAYIFYVPLLYVSLSDSSKVVSYI
jgi:hypothetical protein